MTNKNPLYQKIYEDDDYIVLNKPSGLLVIPDRYDADKNNLYDLLLEEYGEIFINHRIDKDTSGIVCFSKNSTAHKEINKQFENHSVNKKYIALVSGCPPEDTGCVSIPIAPHEKKQNVMVINHRFGKKSKTFYKVLEKYKYYALVEAEPVTGRMHQIRVHFLEAGFPLAVDPVYNKDGAIYLSELKGNYHRKKDEEERPLINRLTLHAKSISFYHYSKSENVTFEAELPKDFNSLLKQLRKFAKG